MLVQLVFFTQQIVDSFLGKEISAFNFSLLLQMIKEP